jgi:ribosomal protein L11 methylase PrmA
LSSVQRHPASYRDPESSVLVDGDRVLRGLRAEGLRRYRAFCDSGALEPMMADGMVIGTRDGPDAGTMPGGFAHVLEHDRIPFISYPYEWPFTLLRRAALHHLDVQLRALDHGFTLSDATAYNVQFRGVRPVFIDLGSFRPYRTGELWSAHRQFCEQMLNPLLLMGELGIPFQGWLRGSPEGIPTAWLARLAPATKWFGLRWPLHVLLPARAERRAAEGERDAVERIRNARMPVEGYRAMLRQLRAWIESLRAEGARGTVWADYSRSRTYASAEVEDKRRLVREFAQWARPEMLWDFGCNDGEFAQVALEGGARRAIGFDADAGALEQACERAAQGGLDLLPLHQDAADPSPASGWRHRERMPLLGRARPDAVMALAFEHHLAIGRNVPLEEVVDFLASVAPRGLVEFVPKSDPTVQRMLALKGDLFPHYTQEGFEAALAARARIVRSDATSGTGRRLYWFER